MPKLMNIKYVCWLLKPRGQQLMISINCKSRSSDPVESLTWLKKLLTYLTDKVFF